MEADALQQNSSELRAQVYEDVGARLRAYRENADVGLRELARRVGLSASMISQIETGKTQPSVSTLYLIVSELGVSLDELFSPDGAPPDTQNGRNPRSDGDRQLGEPSLPDVKPPAAHSEPAGPVQRADSRKAIKLAGGVRWERLTAQHDREVDFLHVLYEPGAASRDAH